MKSGADIVIDKRREPGETGDGRLLRGGTAWQSQPRVPSGGTGGGQWTSGGSEPTRVHGSASVIPDCAIPVQPKKAAFVDRYFASAQKAAAMLRIPLENLLGVAALESNWGSSRFAQQGNNLFGMYYPTPYATGAIVAQGNARARLATFPTPDAAFLAFATNTSRD
jgi:hypothetical protein